MSLKIIAYEFDYMTEELLKQLGLTFNGLAIRGGILFNLVQSLPEPAHIKDSKTGKYICSNESNLEVYGLTEISQILGKTVQDLDSFMKPFWGETFAGNITNFDEEVCERKEVIQEKDKVFIAKNGLIHVQDMTKAPIFNGNEVSAIFTHSHDKTDNVELFRLFGIYQEVYGDKKDAIQYFCKYLKIDSFFIETPTAKEIEVLLHAKNSRQIDGIADKMYRSKRNVETHITGINTKINKENHKEDFDYNDIVEFIMISRSSKLKP